MSNLLDDILLEKYKKEADKLDISLQEYLSFLILKKLDNLSVITFSGESN